MSKYDFDSVIDRHGTYATKFDGLDQMFGRHDVTPLWIADLDFAVCPDITAALRRRLDHPVLGYSAARTAIGSQSSTGRSIATVSKSPARNLRSSPAWSRA